MKGLISLIISLFCCMSINAKAPTEFFSAGNPIEYCGTQYYLAWATNPIENYYYLQEYLPKGETLEHYNQMFTISIMFWDKDPSVAVKSKIEELEERKKTDPITNYMVAENNGEYILEFLVSDSGSGSFNTVELDIHYYKRMTINGRKAIVLYFYSERAYGDDIKPFIKSISEKRASLYEGMSNLKLHLTFPKK